MLHPIDFAARILTARLLLRRPRASDLETVHAIHSDPETNRFNPSGPQTRAGAETSLQTWLAHWEELGFGYWAVCLPDAPDQAIGYSGIMRKTVGDRPGLNLYFRFAAQAWGKGYATEAAGAALDLAFRVLQENEVLAKVRPANLPSRRALERLGMVVIGETADVAHAEASLIYRLAACDYAKHREN